MAPIRVCIIGLSSVTGEISASPGDGWAASAHLPYLIASPRYEIVALCNSSVKSAETAISRHGLTSAVKAYGNPEDVAEDPDVDLVVCSVRVDRHYQVMMPILEAGKDAFIEWPVGSNLKQAEELLSVAQKSGSKVVVGLQARTSPIIQKVKSLVQDKTIGDLLSCEADFVTGFGGGVTPPGFEYLSQKETGGNLFTIVYLHFADPLFYALGGLEEASANLTTRWPKTMSVDSEGKFVKYLDRTSFDHVMVHGSLRGSGAPISTNARGGKAFKDAKGLYFRILGTKEYCIAIQFRYTVLDGGEKLQYHDHESDAVEDIDVGFSDEVKNLPQAAKHIGNIYELYAKNGTYEDGLVDLQEAVRVHKLVETLEKSNEEGKALKMPRAYHIS